MNNFPSKEEVARLREKYPAGTRIELAAPMDDPYAKIPTGTRGFCRGVDDAGHLMMTWDSGSGLNLIPGADNFRIVPYISDKAFNQLLEMRKHPDCPNLFDTKAAFALAVRLDMMELADTIFSDTKLFCNLILTGHQEEE